MSLQVNQKGASAQGDVVAGNKTVEVNNYYPSKHVGAVEQLLDKLQAEIEKNQKVRNTIEALAHFKPRQAQDGITGLKAKLEAGNRSNEYFDALEKKNFSRNYLRNGRCTLQLKKSSPTFSRKQIISLTILFFRR